MPRNIYTPEQIIREQKCFWKVGDREYNHIRPHSSLGYIPPAPEAVLPVDANTSPLLFGSATLHLTTTVALNLVP